MNSSLFAGWSLLSLLLFLAAPGVRAAEIERIWLTHQTNDPSKLVVNWETSEPGASVVQFGATSALGETITREEMVALHHVEIPLARRDATYFYRVRSGSQAS